MNVSVDEKMTARSANAGLRAGGLAGLVMGLYSFATILVLRSRVLEQLTVVREKLTPFMPNIDLNGFYLLGLFAVPVAMVLVYLAAGVLFGTIFDKVKTKPRLKVAAFVVLFIFGFFFGLTTNLPASKVLTVGASLCSCLLFTFMFLSYPENRKREKTGAKEKKGKVAVFLAIVAIFTLSLWGFSSLLGIKLIILSPFYMFITFVATILTCLAYRIPLGSLALLAKPNRWFLAAWLLPALLSIVTLGVSLLLPGVDYSPSMEGVSRYYSVSPSVAPEQFALLGLPPLISVLLLGLIAGPTINALFAFGEEIGWRGFLHRELAHLGFWKLSCVTGFIWGLWHAPLILHGLNYPQHPVEGLGMMIVFTTLLSPLLSYIRIRTKSVVGAAITHGTVNAVAGISVAFAIGGSDLIVGLTGLSGFIVLSIVNLVLFRASRLPSSVL
jgi:membrane protease YdiL (CAAX protease family)